MSVVDKPQPEAGKIKLKRKEKKRLRKLIQNLFYEGKVGVYGDKSRDDRTTYLVNVTLTQPMIDDLDLNLPVGTIIRTEIDYVELGKIHIGN